jgi:hypothetical protein
MPRAEGNAAFAAVRIGKGFLANADTAKQDKPVGDEETAVENHKQILAFVNGTRRPLVTCPD